MEFFANISTKKQFKKSLEHVNILKEEIHKSLVPSKNVFWHYKLRVGNRPQEISYETINSSLMQADDLINDLQRLYFNILNEFEKNKKILSKFKNEIRQIKKYVYELIVDNSTTMCEIKTMDLYRVERDLTLIYNYMVKFNKNLTKIIKSEDKTHNNDFSI